jgi:medium-chain acyl-[acyl-carrier-protein] hydrolase
MNDTMNVSSVVPAYETGPNDRMHYHWLMWRLQEAATMHANREGFGAEQLDAKNCFWILTSMCIEIKELPKRNDLFSLTTWSRGAKKLRALREFEGCDESGNTIVRTSSEWMILDSETGKPLNIESLGIDLLPKTKSLFAEKIKRIRPGKAVDEIRTFRVPYSSLDASGHVNNTEYLRWGMDALRMQASVPENISSIRIAFLSEVFEGNTIRLMNCEKTPQGFELLGHNESNNKNSFALQVQ